MGQKTALFYKNWQLTKKQKAGFICQVLSPLICLGLIKLLLHFITSANISPNAMTGTDIIPSTIYPCNLLTPKWAPFYEDLYLVNNPTRINRWAALNEKLKLKFEDWLSRQPGLFKYYAFNDVGENELNPKWEYTEKNTNEELNRELIKNVKTLNTYDRFRLSVSTDLPDSSCLIKRISEKYGVDVDIQVNNIIYNRYHRKNGDSMYDEFNFDPTEKLNNTERKRKWSSGKVLIVSTESSIAHMNYFTNLHLQSIFHDDLVNIISVVSPTVDKGFIMEFFNMALSIVTIHLFPCALCLGFPLMLFVLVLEKEENIKNLLDVNGLVTINYWVAFFFYNFVILEVVTTTFLLVGAYYIDIDFFVKTNFWINFYFMSLWNMAQIAFALFASTYIKSTTVATLIGYTSSIFLVSFICIVSQLLFPNPAKIFTVFYFFPQTSFVRFFYLSISKCIDFKCYRTFWSLFEGEMKTVMISMHLNIIFYFLLGLILNEEKFRKLLKIDKVFKFFKKILFEDKKEKLRYLRAQSDLDHSVVIETDGFTEEKHFSAEKYEEKIIKGDFEKNKDVILTAKKVSKSFKCSTGTKIALSDFSIKIEKGKIFGLLGPNGAGKTTFLSIATNILESDEGKIWIDGNRTNDRTLHSGNIGFCPQFDILWPQLNVLQHLIFLGMFKGFSKKEAISSAKRLIKRVDLQDDFTKKSRQLSGGMKRRCSLAMALTGDPKIIFLDEPSSGLDPVKRRHFWSLIKEVTKDKAALITTHLMEEADTLCDEIGIITTGKLRCIGNSIFLKNQFTDGIKIQIVLKKELKTNEEKLEEYLMFMKGRIKGLTVEEVSQGNMRIVVKNKDVSFSEVFDAMTGEESGESVEDWSLSLGSLEDVFLNVVKRYRESNIFRG